MADTQKLTQQAKVKGNQLVERVRAIIEEGNARRISIRKDGRELIELPLSVGVGGAAAAVLVAPMLAAVGAVAALVSDVEVVVEHDPDTEVEALTKDISATGTGAGAATTPSANVGSAGTTGAAGKSMGKPPKGTSPKGPKP